MWHEFEDSGRRMISSARAAPLSAKAVEKLSKTSAVGGVAGLELVVSRGGTRSWRLYYRIAGDDGRRRALTLGRYPELSLAEARKRAAAALAQASAGDDPKLERAKKSERRRLTVANAAEAYLAACASENAPKTVSDKTSAFRAHLLSRFGERPLTELTRAELLALLDGMAATPGIRRTLYVYLHHFLGWAAEREMIDANPLLGVRPPKAVAARDRVLSDDEIRGLWSADGVTADIAKLALLTAQRRASLIALRWDQVDVDAREWRIPSEAMKSSKPHCAPLSDSAVEIIRRRPPLGGPFVFGVGSFGQRPFKGVSQGVERLKRELGGVDWRFHDLRRTAVTLAQRGGCRIDEIRALTQHKTSGVIGVYARHDYADEKRGVVDAIAGLVQEITASRSS